MLEQPLPYFLQVAHTYLKQSRAPRPNRPHRGEQSPEEQAQKLPVNVQGMIWDIRNRLGGALADNFKQLNAEGLSREKRSVLLRQRDGWTWAYSAMFSTETMSKDAENNLFSRTNGNRDVGLRAILRMPLGEGNGAMVGLEDLAHPAGQMDWIRGMMLRHALSAGPSPDAPPRSPEQQLYHDVRSDIAKLLVDISGKELEELVYPNGTVDEEALKEAYDKLREMMRTMDANTIRADAGPGPEGNEATIQRA